MAGKSYLGWLESEFGNQIDSLGLNDRQKIYLKGRWLDQVIWMEKKANRARNWHYALKVIVIIAGVLLPVLVTTTFSDVLAEIIKITTIALGLIVAGLNAIEAFFNYGDRWRHYRSTVELLKAEWWQYYSGSGRYAGKTFAKNYADFTDRIEDLIRLDVRTYINSLVKEKQDESKNT